MKLKRAIATGIVMTLLATAAISSVSAQDKAQNPPPAPPSGMKVVNIQDPIYEMTAFSLTIPEDWIFQGGVTQGTFCSSAAFPVFRMSAPDGLTGVKWFPRMDWSWPDDPKLVAAHITSNCLPYKQEMPAADFLKLMIGILKVEYVKALPTPNLAALQKGAAANNTPLVTTTVDAANFQVRYHIHQIEIEDHLNAIIFCTTDKTSANAIKHTCSATLARSWAPQGKWSENTFAFTQHSLVMNEKWSEAVYWYEHPTPEEVHRRNDRLSGNLDEAGHHRDHLRLFARLQAEALRKKQYGEFLGAMHRDTDRKVTTDSQAAIAEPPARMPDDWCDYALDQEKVNDHYIGDTMPIGDPPEFNYTWANEKGERIQTKNLNGNPNGNGTGNWRLQETIRKD